MVLNTAFTNCPRHYSVGLIFNEYMLMTSPIAVIMPSPSISANPAEHLCRSVYFSIARHNSSVMIAVS